MFSNFLNDLKKQRHIALLVSNFISELSQVYLTTFIFATKCTKILR